MVAFIACDEMLTGTRAAGMLNEIGEHVGSEIEFHRTPWVFKALNELRWQEAATLEALKSDVLIIAIHHDFTLPETVCEWFEAVVRRKKGHDSRVVVLLEAKESKDPESPSRLEQLGRACREADLDYMVLTPRVLVDEAFAHIQDRADTVTPVLEQILTHEDYD